MGTSSAYGGSVGWNGARRDTSDWLDTVPRSPVDGTGGSGDGQPPPNHLPTDDLPPSPEDRPPSRIDPLIARILAGVVSRLAADVVGASGGGARRGGRERTGGDGRSRRGRAGASGGAAVAGAYGLRSGDAAALRDVGLMLADLDGLSPFEQARRIVEASSGPTALIEQDELREVNANFIWWSIEHGEDASPADLIRAWVIEFVYRTWLTEAGSLLRDGTRNGATTHALEREVRVTLEAAASHVRLPTDGLRAADFEAAIGQLLGMLARIFRREAA